MAVRIGDQHFHVYGIQLPLFRGQIPTGRPRSASRARSAPGCRAWPRVLAGRTFPRFPGKHLGRKINIVERVVQLVRHARRQRADGCEFFRLDQLLIFLFQLLLVEGKLVFHVVELVDQHTDLVMSFPVLHRDRKAGIGTLARLLHNVDQKHQPPDHVRGDEEKHGCLRRKRAGKK